MLCCTKTRASEKMKRLAGRPMSAFVAYSKMRKNTENIPVIKKKMKKKTTKLSEILPVNLSTKSIDNCLLTKETQPATERRKQIRKRPIKTLPNGNSIGAALVPKEPKKKKTKKSMKNQSLDNLLNVCDSDVSHPEKDKFENTQIGEIPVNNVIEKQTQSKKKKDKSPAKGSPILSPSERNEEPEVNKNIDMNPQEEIPKCLSNNPIEEGKSLFQWLIHPLSMDNFFKNNWERAPLHIKRSKANYYKLLMSTPLLDTVLRNFHIIFTKNIDITSYSNGQRETHNPPGRALPSVVWDYYSNGCSIRMLNPQTFIPKLHALNGCIEISGKSKWRLQAKLIDESTLQEFFGCFVGANSYLTPPDSQGFAPHYDDIEAFILQIEGKKRWRLYKPPTEGEYLPRYSSKNFDSSEIGEPILDTVVNAGDLLYFPRGTIHQGETIDGTHSLHITLSVYQKNSWCDYLEKLLPEALKSAVASDSRFREGLPMDYLRNVGFVHSSMDNETRRNFIEKTKDLLHRLVDHIDVDKVADQMAKGNIHDFLPPVLAPQEQECSILKDGERMTVGGLIENRVEIEPDTRIRLLRSHCIRLIEEEDSMKIYYSTENSKEYHEYEPQFLEVGKELAPALQEIIRAYPDFVRVDDLPIEGEDNKVQVARDLWEKCIVVTDVPLPIVD